MPITSTAIIEIARNTLWNVLKISTPLLGAALISGLIISLLQALTQMQDQTIAFVPKFVVIITVLSCTLPYIGDVMSNFTNEIMVTVSQIK